MCLFICVVQDVSFHMCDTTRLSLLYYTYLVWCRSVSHVFVFSCVSFPMCDTMSHSKTEPPVLRILHFVSQCFTRVFWICVFSYVWHHKTEPLLTTHVSCFVSQFCRVVGYREKFLEGRFYTQNWVAGWFIEKFLKCRIYTGDWVAGWLLRNFRRKGR